LGASIPQARRWDIPPKNKRGRAGACALGSGFEQSLETQISQRVRSNITADVLDGLRRRQKLGAPRSVDAVVTGMRGRGRGNAHVHFFRAGFAQKFDELFRRGPHARGLLSIRSYD
jgi:hypothetical protein